MNSRSLHAVLRSLADAEPLASDGELLRRFVGGNEAAFAELVRRHGRLVWAVCRHLTHSGADADDAFQATFLVLLRNAKKIRDTRRLSAWLHGVAYKVCAKSRLTAKRRATRERAAAISERNGSAVSDSTWDRSLAAVHEEVSKLPEVLRVPFVLCCFEGKGVTEAAEQLGWKLGTFSGRLTRAKDALVARLDARGLTLGALAGLGLASPPAVSIANASSLARMGFVIPNAVLQLTQGVIGMSMTSLKVLAAAILLTCGLGIGAGTGWVATAEAQPAPKQPPTKSDSEAEAKKRQAEALKQAQADEDATRERDLLAMYKYFLAAGQKGKEEAFAAKTTKWEYDFVEVSDLSQTKFVEFLQDRENRGWEFNGSTTLKSGARSGAIWVFRRPAKGISGYQSLMTDYYRLGVEMNGPKATQLQLPSFAAKPDDPKAVAAEIARLRERLASLEGKSKVYRVTFPKEDLPLEAAYLTEVLLKLAGKKFKDAHFAFYPSASGIAVEGDKDVIEWATELIKKLAEK